MSIPQSVPDDAGRTPHPRPFAILDAMILVAVFAFGIAWNQLAARDYYVYNSPFTTSPSFRKWPYVHIFNSALWNLLPHLILWSLMLSALALVKPPRSLRDKVRQPGIAACWVASLAILFHAAWYIPFRIRHHPGNVLTGGLLIQTFDEGAFAVGGAWLVLAVGGLWQAQRHWIDRAGRAVGVSWFVAALFYNFRNQFW